MVDIHSNMTIMEKNFEAITDLNQAFMKLLLDSDLDIDAINAEVKAANEHAKRYNSLTIRVEELNSLTTEDMVRDLKQKTGITATEIQKA